MLLFHVASKAETLALMGLTSDKLEFAHVTIYHELRPPITSQ